MLPELLTQRAQVSAKIKSDLTARAKRFPFNHGRYFHHRSYLDEFTAAVEAKQVAQQEAESEVYRTACGSRQEEYDCKSTRRSQIC